jgi:hypothetical protein
MKKRKKIGGLSKTAAYHQSPRALSVEMKQEELAKYIQLAEKQVIPLIKKTQMDAGAAQFLLAQYTQALITKNAAFSLESAMTIANTVLALWREGYYTPSSDYPYTLEETLQALEGGPKAKADYTDCFQPFIPMEADRPRGLKKIAGGIVQHPETLLWQIWMIMDGPCEYFGAYLDPAKAQCELEELIRVARRGASPAETVPLYRKLASRWDGKPKQLPYDMIVYLIDNLEHYTIYL